MASVMTLDFLAVKGHFIIFYLKCLRQKLIFFIIFKSKVNHFRKIKVLLKRNSFETHHMIIKDSVSGDICKYYRIVMIMHYAQFSQEDSIRLVLLFSLIMFYGK